MSELKRCPFCGGEAKICDGYIEEFLKTEYMKYVQCNYCKASTKLYFTEKEAIKAWNTRKPMERILERLETELELSDKEKRRADMFQFDRAVGYSHGISNAIDFIKEEGGVE